MLSSCLILPSLGICGERTNSKNFYRLTDGVQWRSSVAREDFESAKHLADFEVYLLNFSRKLLMP